ncbi:NAD-dependent epimerase/dehydratase family protein [Amycolatopsis methanolica]|uniref:UDP-glucose 4-epimerase n=1 Tax=Amycolatopsis methanolica 239 TaxID=1068978 RepID=A0A076MIU6_AMYME|nr:NAD-dependent epimerase/dehydratase family protein [Amycolatopsis methanolica]AIJ20664.1 UDP-glucose 4-epimerase [Amycolatopsis methanolica 239]
MRVLVTGAAGFLGQAVIAALLDRGHEPVAFIREGGRLPRQQVESAIGDVRDLESLRAVVQSVDGVCHLAALTRVRESFAGPLWYWRTNVLGTLNLLEVLGRKRPEPARLVLASTAAVYGTPETQPISEDAPIAPTNPYGATKAAADLAAANVAATGRLGAISLRAFNIAGAVDGHPDRDFTRLIPKVLAVQAGLAEELGVNGDGTAVRDFVHVADMAHAFVLAIEACTPGEWRAYNVGSGRETSINDVLAAAEQITGRPVRIKRNPPANEPRVLLADSRRIREELGWQAPNSDLSQILSDGWKALTSAYAAPE